MGRLEVIVCGARSIADRQVVGMPDPYVKLKMGDEKKNCVKYKTRVIDNSLDPQWNERFIFYVADVDSSQILFEVWNDNVMVDDLLGFYRLSLNGLQRGVVKDMWVALSGAKVSSAELHLRVLAVDFGLPPEAGAKIVQELEKMDTPVSGVQRSRPARHTSPSPAASQGVPPTTQPPGALPISQQVTYAPVYQPAVTTAYPVPPGTGQAFVAYPAPPQPMYAAPPPQPMYAAPSPQPMYAAPPPQPMYAYPYAYAQAPPPPPPQPPMTQVQMAHGVPPM